MSSRHVWAVVTGIVWASFIAGVGVAELDGGVRLRIMVPVGLFGVVAMLGSLVVTLRLWSPQAPAPTRRPMSIARPRVAPSPLAQWTPPAQPGPPMTAWDWVTRPGPRGPHESTRVLEVVPEARPLAVAEPEPEPAPADSIEFVAEELGTFLAGEQATWEAGIAEGERRARRRQAEPPTEGEIDA